MKNYNSRLQKVENTIRFFEPPPPKRTVEEAARMGIIETHKALMKMTRNSHIRGRQNNYTRDFDISPLTKEEREECEKKRREIRKFSEEACALRKRYIKEGIVVEDEVEVAIREGRPY